MAQGWPSLPLPGVTRALALPKEVARVEDTGEGGETDEDDEEEEEEEAWNFSCRCADSGVDTRDEGKRVMDTIAEGTRTDGDDSEGDEAEGDPIDSAANDGRTS